MNNLTVIGAQWGDEGKGKFVDVLAGEVDVVVRFAGGANAGHTIVVEGEQHVLHLLPSGILHPEKECMLAAGVVIDPQRLVDEMEEVRRCGVAVGPERLTIARRAHLVLPHHIALDKLGERGKNAIGTTLRGIGPAYEDKASRRGVRMGDLEHGARLSERVARAVDAANVRLKAAGEPLVEVEEVMQGLHRLGEALVPFVGDVTTRLHRRISQGKRILFEGAQGVLLDIDQGSYPFVTSSNTGAGGVCVGAGVGPRHVGGVIGVAKAYLTRVGAGPFPTELDDPLGSSLRQAGGEFGATTGRPRRCGWLDLVALRHAVRVGGIDALALTKIDVLAGMEQVAVCEAYELDGARLDGPPADPADWERVEPVYRPLGGWQGLEATQWASLRADDLPPPVSELVAIVEQAVEVPVVLLSMGPGRDETLRLPSSVQWLS